MQTCSVCQIQSSDSVMHCDNCQADLSQFSLTSIARKKFLANDRVKYMRIVTYADCCPACRHAEGAYPKDSVPVLPVEGCSHANGCRCFYLPFLDELYP